MSLAEEGFWTMRELENATQATITASNDRAIKETPIIL